MLIEMKYFFVRLVRIIRIQRIKIYYFKMPKKSLFLQSNQSYSENQKCQKQAPLSESSSYMSVSEDSDDRALKEDLKKLQEFSQMFKTFTQQKFHPPSKKPKKYRQIIEIISSSQQEESSADQNMHAQEGFWFKISNNKITFLYKQRPQSLNISVESQIPNSTKKNVQSQVFTKKYFPQQLQKQFKTLKRLYDYIQYNKAKKVTMTNGVIQIGARTHLNQDSILESNKQKYQQEQFKTKRSNPFRSITDIKNDLEKQQANHLQKKTRKRKKRNVPNQEERRKSQRIRRNLDASVEKYKSQQKNMQISNISLKKTRVGKRARTQEDFNKNLRTQQLMAKMLEVKQKLSQPKSKIPEKQNKNIQIQQIKVDKNDPATTIKNARSEILQNKKALFSQVSQKQSNSLQSQNISKVSSKQNRIYSFNIQQEIKISQAIKQQEEQNKVKVMKKHSSQFGDDDDAPKLKPEIQRKTKQNSKDLKNLKTVVGNMNISIDTLTNFFSAMNDKERSQFNMQGYIQHKSKKKKKQEKMQKKNQNCHSSRIEQDDSQLQESSIKNDSQLQIPKLSLNEQQKQQSQQQQNSESIQQRPLIPEYSIQYEENLQISGNQSIKQLTNTNKQNQNLFIGHRQIKFQKKQIQSLLYEKKKQENSFQHRKTIQSLALKRKRGRPFKNPQKQLQVYIQRQKLKEKNPSKQKIMQMKQFFKFMK